MRPKRPGDPDVGPSFNPALGFTAPPTPINSGCRATLSRTPRNRAGARSTRGRMRDSISAESFRLL